jgi:hypothetical protein
MSFFKNLCIKIDVLHGGQNLLSYLLYIYNESKHNILALVGNAKKNENQNKSLQSECLVKFALRNFFDVYQKYESIYQKKYQ